MTLAQLQRHTHWLRAGLTLFIVLGLAPSMIEGTREWYATLVLDIPLMAFIPLLGAQHPRRYAWLCFVILAYFCSAVLDAFLWPSLQGKLGVIAVVVSIACFLVSMYASRWAEHLKQRPASDDA